MTLVSPIFYINLYKIFHITSIFNNIFSIGFVPAFKVGFNTKNSMDIKINP